MSSSFAFLLFPVTTLACSSGRFGSGFPNLGSCLFLGGVAIASTAAPGASVRRRERKVKQTTLPSNFRVKFFQTSRNAKERGALKVGGAESMSVSALMALATSAHGQANSAAGATEGLHDDLGGDSLGIRWSVTRTFGAPVEVITISKSEGNDQCHEFKQRHLLIAQALF